MADHFGLVRFNQQQAWSRYGPAPEGHVMSADLRYVLGLDPTPRPFRAAPGVMKAVMPALRMTPAAIPVVVPTAVPTRNPGTPHSRQFGIAPQVPKKCMMVSPPQGQAAPNMR